MRLYVEQSIPFVKFMHFVLPTYMEYSDKMGKQCLPYTKFNLM